MEPLRRRKSSVWFAIEETKHGVDHILERLGKLGRYQLLQTTWMFVSNTTIAFQLFNMVFLAQEVSNHCVTPVGASNASDGCEYSTPGDTANSSDTVQCSAWTYDDDKSRSTVSEWDLVCSNTAFARLPQSMFVIGQGIGALLFSILADKYGRKPVMLVTHCLTAATGFGLAFSPNIETFTALRFVNGAFQQGVVMTVSTMCLEIFPENLRLAVATVHGLAWSMCPLLLTLVSWSLRYESWRTLQLVFSAMSGVVILQIIFLDESLRWLIANNKKAEATAIVKKAARMNKVDPGTVIPMCEQLSGLVTQDHGEETGTGPAALHVYSCLDIIRSRFMLKTVLIVGFTWMVDSLTYFSLYLTSSSLADDLYLNFFLNSLAEVPTAPLFWFISRRIGRRRFFLCFHFIGGSCLLISTALRTFTENAPSTIAATTFAFIGKLGNSACFTSLFVYVPEIYPTNIRTAGLGAGSTSARLGAVMAPFTKMLMDVVNWVPGLVFGVASLVAAVMIMLLPEAEGKELPETIEEIKLWNREIGKGKGLRSLPSK